MYFLLLAIIYIAFISLGLGAAWPSMYRSLNVSEGSAGILTLLMYSGTMISSMASDKIIRKLGTGLVLVLSVSLTTIVMFGFSMAESFDPMPVSPSLRTWWRMCRRIAQQLCSTALQSPSHEFPSLFLGHRHHYQSAGYGFLFGTWRSMDTRLPSHRLVSDHPGSHSSVLLTPMETRKQYRLSFLYKHFLVSEKPPVHSQSQGIAYRLLLLLRLRDHLRLMDHHLSDHRKRDRYRAGHPMWHVVLRRDCSGPILIRNRFRAVGRHQTNSLWCHNYYPIPLCPATSRHRRNCSLFTDCSGRYRLRTSLPQHGTPFPPDYRSQRFTAPHRLPTGHGFCRFYQHTGSVRSHSQSPIHRPDARVLPALHPPIGRYDTKNMPTHIAYVINNRYICPYIHGIIIHQQNN